MSTSERIGRILLPPIQAAIAAAALITLSRLAPVVEMDIPGLRLLGVLLGLSGVILAALAVREVRAHRTTVHPHGTPSSLVATGPFAASRNPIYLGMELVLTGIACWLGGLSGIIVLVLFPLALLPTHIRWEERTLRREFGADYDEYCAHVRRWL